MTVYLVLALSLGGLSKPWGVYSNIDNAMQAQEDCSVLYEPSWHDFVHGDLAYLLEQDRCVIWQWQVDGPRVGYAPTPQLPKADIPEGGVPAIP